MLALNAHTATNDASVSPTTAPNPSELANIEGLKLTIRVCKARLKHAEKSGNKTSSDTTAITRHLLELEQKLAVLENPNHVREAQFSDKARKTLLSLSGFARKSVNALATWWEASRQPLVAANAANDDALDFAARVMAVVPANSRIYRQPFEWTITSMSEGGEMKNYKCVAPAFNRKRVTKDSRGIYVLFWDSVLFEQHRRGLNVIDKMGNQIVPTFVDGKGFLVETYETDNGDTVNVYANDVTYPLAPELIAQADRENIRALGGGWMRGNIVSAQAMGTRVIDGWHFNHKTTYGNTCPIFGLRMFEETIQAPKQKTDSPFAKPVIEG